MTDTNIRSFNEHFVSGDGADLAVTEWPGAKGPLVCVHGLTSHSRAFAGLATELADHRVVAVDCRGRGRSSKERPFGIEQHVADLLQVTDGMQIGRATVVGHSMGAFIAGAFGARHPERVDRLVFVDGGYPQEYPPGTTPDDLLETLLGTVLERVRRIWSSPGEYLAFLERTPAFRRGVDHYTRAHIDYDLAGAPPRLRARVAEECIAPDWRDLVDHEIVGKRLESLKMPLLVIRAPGGLTGMGDEIITDAALAAIVSKVPETRVIDVPGTNHYTILLSVTGARAVAHAIEEFVR